MLKEVLCTAIAALPNWVVAFVALLEYIKDGKNKRTDDVEE